MTELFAPVDVAANRFSLTNQDPLGLSRYPSERTWNQYGTLAPEFRALVEFFEAGNALLLRGLPGTGKTFAALQFGHEWESESQPKGRPPRYARYALARMLTASAVDDLWHAEFPPGEFLWIIDDIHEAPAITREVVELFRARLEPLGHRLLLVGWQSPDDVVDITTIGAALTERLIARVLRDQDLAVPSVEARRALAASRTMGLRVIMAIAQYEPGLLERGEPRRALRLWLDHVVHRLGTNPDATAMVELATDIAVLQFLGLRYVPAGGLDELRLLRRLSDVGLALEAKPAGWQVVDDERARALSLLSVEPGRLSASFFERLTRLTSRQSELSAAILRRLRGRSVATLTEWLGIPLASTASHLLEALEEYAPALAGELAATTMPLEDVANAVEVLRRPGQIAAQVLEVRRAEIRRRLPSGDVRLWDGIRRLSASAGTDEYDALLASVRKSASFGDGVREALGPTRDYLVHSIATEGRQAPGDGAMLASLVLARDAEGDATAWRFIERVARHHPSLAREAVGYVPDAYLFRMLLSSPSRFLLLLARLDRRKGMQRRLKKEAPRAQLPRGMLDSWRKRDIEYLIDLDRSLRLRIAERTRDTFDPRNSVALLQSAALAASTDGEFVVGQLATCDSETLASAIALHPDAAHAVLGNARWPSVLVRQFRTALTEHAPEQSDMARWPEWRLRAYANLGRRLGVTSSEWARRRIELRPGTLWKTIARDFERGIPDPMSGAIPREVVLGLVQHPDDFMSIVSRLDQTRHERLLTAVREAVDGERILIPEAGTWSSERRVAYLKAAETLMRPKLATALSAGSTISRVIQELSPRDEWVVAVLRAHAPVRILREICAIPEAWEPILGSPHPLSRLVAPLRAHVRGSNLHGEGLWIEPDRAAGAARVFSTLERDDLVAFARRTSTSTASV